MSKDKYQVDKSFQKLAIQVNNTLIKNQANLDDQKHQVEQLMQLELKLLGLFNKYVQTQDIYALFLTHIREEIGNIIVAQIYFRADRDFFTKNISPAFKAQDHKALMKFHPNYMLIQFVMDNWQGNIPQPIKKVYNDFIKARQVLIENNIPLAINRAKKFYRKVPRGNLDLLDFVDICVTGLIRGIDKYSGEYRPVWASVCIGQMVSFMLEEYNNYLIRMFPSDKKILYRINSLRHKLKTNDIPTLTREVNASFERDALDKKPIPKLPIDQFKIMELLNSSNSVAEVEIGDNEYTSHVSVYDLNIGINDVVFDAIEKEDLMRKVSNASQDLLTLEKKVIKLKGVNL